MRRFKKIATIFLVMLAVGLLSAAAGYTVFVAKAPEEEQWVYKEAVVERATLKAGVKESGALTYGTTSLLYELDLDVSDDDDDSDDDETVQKYLKIEKVYAVPGKRIEEGDVLIAFTKDSVEDVRFLLKNALTKARTEYAEAEADYNLSVLTAKCNYETTQLAKQYASVIYETAIQSQDSGIVTIQVEIDRCIANIEQLQEKVEEAGEIYDEIWKVFKDVEKPSVEEEKNTANYMTLQTSYLNLQTQYENAKSALDSAQKAYDENMEQIASLTEEITDALAKRGIDQMELAENYSEAIINGENVQTTYETELESPQETLAKKKEASDKLQRQLDEFEAFVGADGCLYADGGGIVTEVSCEAGDRLKTKGSTLLSYAAPTDMTISVDVAQEDVVDLKVGDAVDITFTAYEDASYAGSIQTIHTTSTSEGSSTVSYSVVIAVEGDTSLLYGGMTADVIFVTKQRENVLIVSRKAIVEENGKTCVYYQNASGAMELKEVVTGLDNGVGVEIVSGLEEGDTIYLASRVSSEDAVMGGGQ